MGPIQDYGCQKAYQSWRVLSQKFTDMATGWRPQLPATGAVTDMPECPRDTVAGLPRANDPRESKANTKSLLKPKLARDMSLLSTTFWSCRPIQMQYGWWDITQGCDSQRWASLGTIPEAGDHSNAERLHMQAHFIDSTTHEENPIATLSFFPFLGTHLFIGGIVHLPTHKIFWNPNPQYVRM